MSLKYIWLIVFVFFVQLLIIMNHVNSYFQSILGILIVYSTFRWKAGRFFLFLVNPQVTWSASYTSTCSKLWEAWELPLSVPFVSLALPLGESQIELPILDCEMAFPFHGEVMENSNGFEQMGVWEADHVTWGCTKIQNESSCFSTLRKVEWNMNVPKIDWK